MAPYKRRLGTRFGSGNRTPKRVKYSTNWADLGTAVDATRLALTNPIAYAGKYFLNKPGLHSAAKSWGGYRNTPFKGPMKRRRQTYSSYLAGRRRYLKNTPLRSKRKRTMAKFDNRGARLNWEEGLDITDSKCIFIGHALPLKKVFNVFTRSLYRNLMKGLGHPFQVWTQYPILASDANPLVKVEYMNDKGTLYSFQFGIVYSFHESMWSTFNTQLWNQLVDVDASPATAWRNGFKMERISMKLGNAPLVQYIDSYELYCGGAICRFNYLQSLKVQNVTPAADGATHDNADDIFNVPLHGRLYEGSGNALKFKSTYYQDLAPTTSISATDPSSCSAIIRAKTGGAADVVPAEPPEAYEFKNCSKFSKVSLNPGMIKTSVVSSQFSVNIDRFLTYIMNGLKDDGSGAAGYYYGHQMPLGKVRVFAMEKVIGNVSGTEDGLRLRAECDTKLQCFVKTKTNNFLAPKNEVI